MTFDDDLRARLRKFQEENGLRGDAVAGEKTWAALAAATPAAEPAAEPVEAARTMAEFPTVTALVQTGGTEEGITKLVRDQFGLDLDAVLAQLDDAVPA
jgi:hypothetical protein